MMLALPEYMLYQIIDDVETPKELWAHLDERFGKQNKGFGPNPFKSKQSDAFSLLDDLIDHESVSNISHIEVVQKE